MLWLIWMVGAASAASVDQPAGPELPVTWTAGPELVDSVDNDEGIISLPAVWDVARVMGRDYLDIALTDEPIGGQLYRDFDGEPSALALSWGGEQALSSDELYGQAQWWAEGVAEDQEGAALGYLSVIGDPQLASTVIAGVRPDQTRLIEARGGLLPSALGPLAEATASASVGESAVLDRIFYEPRMPAGWRWGALVHAGPEQSAVLLPSPGFPVGIAMTASAYQEVRDALRGSYEAELGEELGMSGATASQIAAELHAETWGQTLAYSGAAFPQSPPWDCDTCDLDIFDLMKQGEQGWMDDTAPGMADSCECEETTLDGTTTAVDDCDDVACCDGEDGEAGDDPDCVDTCACDCSGSRWKTVSHPVEVRGVLDLYQYRVMPQFDKVYCKEFVAVGCGPIVASELMIWYSQRGLSSLTDDVQHLNGVAPDPTCQDGIDSDLDGDIDCDDSRCAHDPMCDPFVDFISWSMMADELRTPKYLNGNCWGGVTYVTKNKLASGMEEYAADRGVNMTVTRTAHTESVTDASWAQITREIDASRPMILGYTPVDGSEVIDAFGTVDPEITNREGLGAPIQVTHYGVLTGYGEDAAGLRTVEVNTGWSSQPRRYEWEIGYGRVHLYDVVVSDPLSTGWCPYDHVSDYLFEAPQRGGDNQGYWSMHSSGEGRDAWKVQADLVTDPLGDTECDLIGGDITMLYTSTWTDTVHCLTPDEKERLDETIEEVERIGPR
jgi:hypothetical protein